MATTCYHCGDDCLSDKLIFEEKSFCCSGCKTVYQILHQEGMDQYYNIENTPGVSQKGVSITDYDFIDNDTVRKQIYEFSDGTTGRVTLSLPAIHCSSCIWLLENLHKLNPGIVQSRVNFLEKNSSIVFKEKEISLKELLVLLDKIGYPPDLVNSIEAKSQTPKEQSVQKALIYKIAVAGFCFGNIMLLSFPEYLDVQKQIDASFETAFRYLALILAIPVLLYSASDYLTTAYKSIRSNYLSIDVPIALGILTLFFKSAYDVIFLSQPGYFDSLAGLVFFLLIGKWFQEKTYNSLSFSRDYKSFFPLAFKIKENEQEVYKTLDEIEVGDETIIRNGEVIPADGTLLNAQAAIDYSFVTGESVPVVIQQNQPVFAGGQVMGQWANIRLDKEVSNSYLVKLWNERDDKQLGKQKLGRIIDRISKYFTIAVISIATLAAIYWFFKADAGTAAKIFASVLIIACPCALSLAFPFTFGHAIKYLGKQDVFFKNAGIVERLANVSHFVFDKTGTLTNSHNAEVSYEGEQLDDNTLGAIKLIARNSTHPLSTVLGNYLDAFEGNELSITNFFETVGKGVTAQYENQTFLLGSLDWLKENNITTKNWQPAFPKIHVAINGNHKGVFVFQNEYRKGIFDALQKLKEQYTIHVLSGDEAFEKEVLGKALGIDVDMRFKQNPFDKKTCVHELQTSGEVVAMLGDGLNDAGALQQSDVGVSVIEKIGAFSPASDIIIKGEKLNLLPTILAFSKSTVTLLRSGLVFSLLYNVVGLSIAITGNLTPLIAAILMPISSITVVAWVTFGGWLLSKKYKLQ